VINAVWISISDPIEFFQNPVQLGSDSEVQNAVGSRSGLGSCSTLIHGDVSLEMLLWQRFSFWEAPDLVLSVLVLAVYLFYIQHTAKLNRPMSSEISDLCEISDLLLFVCYFASQSEGIKFGDYF